MADVTKNITTLKEGLRAATQEASRLSVVLSTIDENVNPKRFEVVQAAIQANIEKTAKFKDEIQNVNEQINILAGGSQFEKISNNLGDITGKIKSLDFSGAAESAQNLTKLTKQINFKTAKDGLVDLGKTFINLGKALLTNPLFLLASVITLIVVAIVKLLDKIGVLNVIMDKLSEAFDLLMIPINAVIDALKRLVDWLGITDNAGAEKAQNTLDNANKEQKAIEKRYEAEIAIASAAGKDTKKLELEKIQAVRNSVNQQIKALEQLEKSNRKLTDEQKAQLEELKEAYSQTFTDQAIIEAQTQKEREEAAAEAEEKRKQKAKERADKIKSEQSQVNKFLADEQEKRFQESLSAEDRELRQAELKYKELVKLANGNTAILLKVEEDYRNKKDGITAKYDALDAAKLAQDNLDRIAKEDAQFQLLTDLTSTQYEKKIEAIVAQSEKEFEISNGNAELDVEITRKRDEAISAVNTEFRDKRLSAEQEAKLIEQKAEEELQAAKINAVITGFGVLQTLFKGNEKAQKALFVAQKAFEAGQVIVNGIKTNATLVSQIVAATPLTLNPFTAVQASATIAAAAKGIVTNKINTAASVAAIAATTFGKLSGGGGGSTPSTGGGGGGTGPTPNVTGFGSSSAQATPAFNLFGQGNQLNTGGAPQGIEAGQGGAQPLAITVQVSESEITSTQNFVRRVNESATL
jgi:hypothetical protein